MAAVPLTLWQSRRRQNSLLWLVLLETSLISSKSFGSRGLTRAEVEKAARVAASQAAHTRAKNDLLKKEKPADADHKWMTAERWQQFLKEQVEILDRNFAAHAAGGVEAIEQLDPLGPIMTKLQEEVQFLRAEHLKAARDKATWTASYGTPLGSCTPQQEKNRKAYWVTKRGSMTLLYLCACVLLTAPGASTSNERVHSVCGRILSKYRCSMKPDSLNRSAMGYYWLRKYAEDKARELVAAGLDLMDLDEAIAALPDLDVVIEEAQAALFDEEE